MAALTAGCAVSPCDEFAPAFDRAHKDCPAKPANASQRVPQPLDQPDPTAPRYCYSTLSDVDCFTEPQPNRTGYMGTYAPATPPAAPHHSTSSVSP